jgi:hypothetical protein
MSALHPIVALLDSRLPRKPLVTVPELAAAADIDSSTVEEWIDAGEIDAVDAGGKTQHYWKLSRASVLEFWDRRRLGLRRQAARVIPTTGTLFDHAASGARQAK